MSRGARTACRHRRDDVAGVGAAAAAEHDRHAGAPIGLPDEAPTIATVLKSMGYATGQFGKNHLGDLNQFLPTVHGFDEFFGYLYHLDAMEDPCHPNYPQNLRDTVGPRNMLHSYATTLDDQTVQPRWARSAGSASRMPGRCIPGGWKPSTMRFSTSR
jgi:arylsulfatase A-like enzyme